MWGVFPTQTNDIKNKFCKRNESNLSWGVFPLAAQIKPPTHSKDVSESSDLQRQQHLHGGDVLEKVLDAAGAVPGAPGALEGQQREECAAFGLIAVDLGGRAGAGGRTVQQRAQVVVKEDAEQKEKPPAAPNPRRATNAECAK